MKDRKTSCICIGSVTRPVYSENGVTSFDSRGLEGIGNGSCMVSCDAGVGASYKADDSAS